MSAFFEVSTPGGGSAFIDASLVRGVAKPAELDTWDDAPPSKPLVVFFGDNRELEVFGLSAGLFLVMCHEAKERSRLVDSVTIVGRDDWKHATVRAPGGFDVQVRYAAAAAPDVA